MPEAKKELVYRVWQSRREDIPTHSYNAAVFVDKVRAYIHQTQTGEVKWGALDILTTAHDSINDNWFEGEYVSTYVDR